MHFVRVILCGISLGIFVILYIRMVDLILVRLGMAGIARGLVRI